MFYTPIPIQVDATIYRMLEFPNITISVVKLKIVPAATSRHLRQGETASPDKIPAPSFRAIANPDYRIPDIRRRKDNAGVLTGDEQKIDRRQKNC